MTNTQFFALFFGVLSVILVPWFAFVAWYAQCL